MEANSSSEGLSSDDASDSDEENNDKRNAATKQKSIERMLNEVNESSAGED